MGFSFRFICMSLNEMEVIKMIYELIEYDYGTESEFTLGFFDTRDKAERARNIASMYYEDKGVIFIKIKERSLNILKGEHYEDLGPIIIG